VSKHTIGALPRAALVGNQLRTVGPGFVEYQHSPSALFLLVQGSGDSAPGESAHITRKGHSHLRTMRRDAAATRKRRLSPSHVEILAARRDPCSQRRRVTTSPPIAKHQPA
jgi:hypothetical protein